MESAEYKSGMSMKRQKSKLIKYKDAKGKEVDSLLIDELSGVFYARKYIDGRSHTRSLKTKKLLEAKSRILDVLSDASKTNLNPNSNKLFKDYYNKMIDIKISEGIKSSTLENIDRVWRLGLKPFWELKTVADVNQTQVIEFVKWHKKNRPGVMMENVFKYLGNVFNVMIDEGDLLKKPALNLSKDEEKHIAKQKGRYITDFEANSILTNCKPKFRLIIAIAYTTGMRKAEICELEKHRIIKEKDRYRFVLDTEHTKTGFAREVPLPQQLNDQLEQQLSKCTTYLFPMQTNYKEPIYGQLIDKAWKIAKRKAGIKGRMRFHDLRHTAASNFAKSNINPSIACTVLGMSLTIYQKVYLKLDSNDLMIATDANAKRLNQ